MDQDKDYAVSEYGTNLETQIEDNHITTSSSTSGFSSRRSSSSHASCCNNNDADRRSSGSTKSYSSGKNEAEQIRTRHQLGDEITRTSSEESCTSYCSYCCDGKQHDDSNDVESDEMEQTSSMKQMCIECDGQPSIYHTTTQMKLIPKDLEKM